MYDLPQVSGELTECPLSACPVCGANPGLIGVERLLDRA
jgi:hypothetical protein